MDAATIVHPVQGDLLVCFSHLRWDFVFQRPQHLLTKAARSHDVIYFEEPLFEGGDTATLRVRTASPGIRVATPVLPAGIDRGAIVSTQRRLLDQMLDRIRVSSNRGSDPSSRLHAVPDGKPVSTSAGIAPGTDRHRRLITWYYTPIALSFSDHLAPDVCVYDCMDELSAFKDPPAGLHELETKLFSLADIVFTGGESLYQAKRDRHSRVFAFPSSIDAAHFNKARRPVADPADQSSIPAPRIGFFGVIDERMDLALVGDTARRMPDVQFVMLGPVVKIDPAVLPRADNLHWLGGKSYADLPAYLAHWSAGWMPFALNESTRFISPTKTPEFLAAGLPVVSTAIADVVRPYGAAKLVAIANADDMVPRLRAALASKADPAWLMKVDAFLAGKSWDSTWDAMMEHLAELRAKAATVLMPEGA